MDGSGYGLLEVIDTGSTFGFRSSQKVWVMRVYREVWVKKGLTSRSLEGFDCTYVYHESLAASMRYSSVEHLDNVTKVANECRNSM